MLIKAYPGFAKNIIITKHVHKVKSIIYKNQATCLSRPQTHLSLDILTSDYFAKKVIYKSFLKKNLINRYRDIPNKSKNFYNDLLKTVAVNC